MNALNRPCSRVFTLAALALTFAVIAVGVVTPAVARAGVAGARVPRVVAHANGNGSASAKKPKKAKHSAGNPWGKKDIAEIALLAISPFAIMGLLMFASAYRRRPKAEAPESSPAPNPER